MKSLHNSLTDHKKINLCPKSLQSYEKFIQRLKSFELHKWFAKPPQYSPIECARHGWINISKDMLKCVLCSNILYHYSQTALTCKSFRSNNENKSYTDPKLLIEKHNQNCPWRTLTVSNQLIKIDIFEEEKVLKNFVALKNTFEKCSKLPYLDENILTTFKIPDVLADSFKNKRTQTIFILSSCGWSFKEENDILHCEKCLRSIGLWLYKRDMNLNEEDLSSETSAPSSKENKDFIELFGSIQTDTDSDEILVIKNLLNKMVNSIDIEQSSPKKENEKVCKKRKLEDSQDEEEYLAKIQENSSEAKKKIFDPISSHQCWCPWLEQNDYSFNSSVLSDEKKITHNENMCQLNFKVICKFLSKKSKPAYELSKNHDRIFMNYESITSETLLEKVKSVQSILTKCTSQFAV